MKISNHISAHRLLLLHKQYVNLHLKQALIIFGAMVDVIAGIHIYMHLANLERLERSFSTNYHLPIFLIAFIGGCLIWCGMAFPGFRSKEKTMEYLLLPATTMEKYLFEFISRILLYLLLFPIVYWATTNLVTGVFHHFYPNYIDYKFAWKDIIDPKWSTRELALVLSLGFLMFTLPFTGATYFQKLPLLKTILVVALLIGIYVGIGVMLFNGLHIREYNIVNNRILFMYGEEDGKLAGIWAAIVGNLVILTIGYFKIKEKEA